MPNGKVTQTPGAFLEFTDQGGTPLVALNRDGTVACASVSPIFPGINGTSTINILPAPNAFTTVIEASQGPLTLVADSNGTSVGGSIGIASNTLARATTVIITDGQNDVFQMGNIGNSPNIDGISLQVANGRQIQLADNTFNGFAFVQSSGSFQAIGTATTIQAPKLIETQTLTPSSGATAGTTGQIAWDTGFIYICTAGGIAGSATWKKAALSAA